MQEKLLQIVVKMLPFILSQLSEPLKELLGEVVANLEKKAKETDNKIDDVLVDFLKSILNV